MKALIYTLKSAIIYTIILTFIWLPNSYAVVLPGEEPEKAKGQEAGQDPRQMLERPDMSAQAKEGQTPEFAPENLLSSSSQAKSPRISSP